MLGDSVDENLSLDEVILRYESCKLVKMPSFTCKVSLECVLIPKNGSFYDWKTKGLFPF